MNDKTLYRGFGVLAFLVAFVTYLSTVQPSVPFWDCSEFSAAAIWQQVPHPPGAPLFLLVGKLFHLIIPFGDAAWRVNLVASLSSAFTILLLYLISVKVIINLRDEPLEKLADKLAVYGSALIGALALTFSDTFWFNAVESEVYAPSTLFVALIVYLMMRWHEEADKPGSERFLLLIAYLIGLSSGVHLLAILTIFSITLLVYFRKYEFTVKTFVITLIISAAIFWIIYPGIIKWLPSLLDGTLPFKNECKQYFVEDKPIITVFTIGAIIAVIWAFWQGWKKDKPILKLITGSFLLMVIGYSTYTQILLRSNANPPMNENTPKNFDRLTSYLGREQYGDSPFWPRRFQEDDYYSRWYERKNENGEYIYGEWHPPEVVEVECKGEYYKVPKFTKINFAGEINYLLKYQVYHMYVRYFLWNYMGRVSDIQDAGAAFDGEKESKVINHKVGYKDIYPIRFYALPLLFGLFGLFFHFWKDPKMALIYLIMFLLMGVLAEIAQNQLKPQPRERDYFYTGSFFVWCLWIGMGAYFLIDWLSKNSFKTVPVAIILIVSLLLVPVNMAVGGWEMHDRSGNYIPFDYSYNILQSCEKDAIVFTNGDNDTFPLWYLQDVAGVRRDVRVVNLSLGNTLWYIHQLKHREPWGAKKIPLTFSDESLLADERGEQALSYNFGPAQDISIPVPKEVMKKYTDDPRKINESKMSFTFVGKPYTQRNGEQWYLYRVQDKLILDILQQVRWSRPVYFSTTVGSDAYAGLDKFFLNEGMVMRICPVQQRTEASDAVAPEIMDKTLLNVNNSHDYHKKPHYEFKLRNLSNIDVFYDEVHRRLMLNYRSLYVNYAAHCYRDQSDKQKAIGVLDTMNKYISTEQFPMPFELEYKVARLYKEAGSQEGWDKFSDMTLSTCLEIIDNPNLRPRAFYQEVNGRSFGPHRYAANIYEKRQNFDAAKDVLRQLLARVEQKYNEVSTQAGAGSRGMQEIMVNMYDLKSKIKEYDIDKLEAQGKIKEALRLAYKIKEEYLTGGDPNFKYLATYIDQKIQKIIREHNLSEEYLKNIDSSVSQENRESAVKIEG